MCVTVWISTAAVRILSFCAAFTVALSTIDAEGLVYASIRISQPFWINVEAADRSSFHCSTVGLGCPSEKTHVSAKGVLADFRTCSMGY